MAQRRVPAGSRQGGQFAPEPVSPLQPVSASLGASQSEEALASGEVDVSFAYTAFTTQRGTQSATAPVGDAESLLSRVERDFPTIGESSSGEADEEWVRTQAALILLGENPRTITEKATRRGLMDAQAELLGGFLSPTKGTQRDLSAHTLSSITSTDSSSRVSTRIRKRLLLLMGLTGKTLENLTNRPNADRDTIVSDYSDMSMAARDEAIARLREKHPDLKIEIGGHVLDNPYERLMDCLTATGAVTLQKRGSDKSVFGKRLEIATLDSALRACGLVRVAPNTVSENSFWLSHREKGARESDATVVLPGGNILKVDIGFIGGGNTEITMDKINRFPRTAVIGGRKRAVTTVTIVDRLSADSEAWRQARNRRAVLLEMSNPLWLGSLSETLHRRKVAVPAQLLSWKSLNRQEREAFVMRVLGLDSLPNR